MLPTSLKRPTPGPHIRTCLLENRIFLYPKPVAIISFTTGALCTMCGQEETPYQPQTPTPAVMSRDLTQQQGYRLCSVYLKHRLKRMMLCPNMEPSTDKGNKLFRHLEATHLCGPAREKHQPMKTHTSRVLPTLPPLQPLSPVLPATLPRKPEQFPKHPRIPTHSGTLLAMGGGQQ